MMMKTGRTTPLNRVLAILLSLLMLLQSASVFAEDTTTLDAVPETVQEVITEPVSDDLAVPAENAPAETVDTPNEGGKTPAEETGAVDGTPETPDEASGESGENAVVSEENTEIPEGTAAAPAAEPVIDTSESITMTEAGYVPAPPYFEGTLVHEGPDYTITAVIGTDAMFPEDVQMRVSEILPGTEQYELYNQLMEETLEEGEELGEFARYFDISFITVVDGVETEIEPQADIDVQITFQETIALTEESDVQAIHIAENTPEILKTVTDSLEAAVNDDEAIDTVTFSADSFSIYGVVQKIKKILKVITASGATFTVDVTYTSDANIPEDAELIATEITPNDANYNIYREQTALALGADDVKLPGLFDLGIYVNGEKIQPEAPVSVAISLNEGIQEGEKLYVVHFPEGIEAAKEPEPAEAEPKLMAAPRMMRAAAPMTQPAEQQTTEQQTTEKQDTEAAEPETKNETPAVATEVVSEVAVEGETVTFAANGFSVYALAYTVDFHYGDVEYSIPGGGALSLRKLLEVTGIVKNETEQNNASEEEVPAEETTEATENSASGTAGMYDEAMDRFIANIERVEFSNPELVWIEKIEEDKTVGEIREAIGLNTAYSSELTKAEIAEINGTVIKAVDWVIISLKAFTTNETLRITMTDGTVYVIDVTDGQIRTYIISDGGDTYEIIVTYDDSANIPATATLKVRQVGFDEGKFIENVERVNAALEARGESSLGSPVLFEISIMDGEDEIEPAEGSIVHVEVRLVHYAIEQATEESISKDNNDTDSVTDEDDEAKGSIIMMHGEEFPISMEPDEPVVAHITDSGDIEIIENVQNQLDEKWYVMQFDTDSFSQYIFDGSNGHGFGDLPDTIYVGEAIYMLDQGNMWVTGINSIVTETKHSSDNYKTVKAINTGTFRIYQQGNWNNGKNITVTYRPETGHPPEIETIENASIGLTLNLFDYDLDDTLDDYFNGREFIRWYQSADTSALDSFTSIGINAGHPLKFWGAGMDATYGGLNEYHEHGVTSIVKDSTNTGEAGGYPVLSNTYDGESLKYLFDDSNDGNNKKAYMDVDHLFKKDGDYYVYDSDENYAYFDESTNSFEVYNRTYYQKSGSENGSYHSDPKSIGFFPFNKYNSEYDLYVKYNKNLNHHFGLSMSVDFTMPKDPKAVEDSNGDPIVFEFSGDDDLWVFIDGKLAMDIGGVHQPTSGTINFKTGIVTVNGSEQMNNSTFTSRFPDLYNGEKHTLQVFYLERGGCDSNCKIKFNLTQYGKVEFDKVDEDDPSHNLGGAIFEIYKDEDCTIPLKEKRRDGNFYAFVAESDAAGHVQFSDIPLGDYYLKEIKAPVGYPLDSTVHTLKAYVDSSTGVVVVKTTIDNHSIVDGNGHPLKITNKKPDPIDLTLQKEWQDADGNSISDIASLTATFELKRIKTTEELSNPVNAEDKQTAHLTVGWMNNSGTHIYEEMDMMTDTNPVISWVYNSDYTGRKGYILNNEGIHDDNKTTASHPLSPGGSMKIVIIDDSDNGDAISSITISGKQFLGNRYYDFTRVTELDDSSFIYAGEHVENNRVTLPIEGYEEPWKYEFEELPVIGAAGNNTIYYSYYLQEVDNPEWITVVYKTGDNEIGSPINTETNATGSQTVINRVDLGALELTKKVIVSKKDTDNPQTDTIKFQIEGIKDTVTADYNQTVEITFTNGVATAYKIGEAEPVFAENETDIYSILLADLVPGDYRITETDSGSMKLKSVEGGNDDGSVLNKSITVTVTPGKNDTDSLEDTAKATFTNVGPIDIPVVKIWNGTATTEPIEVKLIRYKKDPSAIPELTNGKLRLSHIINGYNGPLEGFEYTAVDAGGQTYTLSTERINSLPAGTYRLHVNEDAVTFPANYSASTTINPEEVTISVGQTSTAVVTTTLEADNGTLVLSHQTAGDYTGEAPNGFVYTAQKADGTGIPISLIRGENSLPVGVYNLFVNSDNAEAISGYDLEGTTINPQQVTIAAGEEKYATATSSYTERIPVNYTLRFEASETYSYTTYNYKTYNYREGTTVTFWFDNNIPQYNPYDTVHVKINNQDLGAIGTSGRQFSVIMNSDITIVLEPTGNSNWGQVINTIHITEPNASSLRNKDYIKARLTGTRIIATNGMASLGSDGAEEGTGNSTPEGYIWDQSFEMTISLTGNDWRNTFENLDAVDENGYEYIYEIVEDTQIPGYTTTYNPADGRIVIDLETITSGNLPDYTVKITNKENTGDLIIEKKVINHTDSESTFSFTVQLTPPTEIQLRGSYSAVKKAADGTETSTTVSVAQNQISNIVLKADEQIKIIGLPAGTSYTVTEVSLPLGYSQGTHINATGTILLDSSVTATMNNEYPTGSLQVTKTLKASEADGFPTEEFSYPVEVTITVGETTYYVQKESGTLGYTAPETPLTVKGTGLNQGTVSLTITGLIYGTYTVTEIEPEDVAVEGYTFILTDASADDESIVYAESTITGQGTVDSETTPAEVYLTNCYVKDTSWPPAADKWLNGTAYSEDAEGYGGYTFTLEEAEDQGTIPENRMTAATGDEGHAVFNAITYSLSDLDGADEKTFYYTLVENRPDEAADEPYIAAGIQYDPKTIYVAVTVTKAETEKGSPRKLQIANDGIKYYSDAEHQNEITAAYFDNTEVGTLTVTKTVTGSYTPAADEEYSFTVMKDSRFMTAEAGTPEGTYLYTGLTDTETAFEIKDEETITFNNLPAGTYTVTEGNAEKAGYTLTTTYQVGGEAAADLAEASVIRNDATAVAIENYYRDAELIITKAISGVDAEDLEAVLSGITFAVTDETTGEEINKTPDITVTGAAMVLDNESGIYSVTLTSLDNDIIPDHTYRITETVEAPNGYRLVSTGYSVSAGTSDLTNDTSSATGALTLTNENTSSGRIDFTNTYEALVDIEATKTWHQYGDAENSINDTLANAEVTFTLQQKIGDGEWTDVIVTEENGENSVSMSVGKTPEADVWKTVWTNLPKYSGDDLIQYKVVETDAKVAGTVITETAEADAATFDEVEGHDNPTAVVNLDNTLPGKTITVTKIWMDGETEEEWPADIASITVGLLQSVNESTPAAVMRDNAQVTITFGDNAIEAAKTFADLPVYDETGALITYSIEELSVTPAGENAAPAPVENGMVTVAGGDSWSVSVVDESNAATITNTKLKTDIEILKVTAGTTDPLTGAKFRLMKQNGEDFADYGDPSEKEVDEYGRLQFTGLTDGNYKLYETKAPDGYIMLTTAITFTVSGGEVKTTGADGKTVKYTEAQDGNPALFTVENRPGSALPSTGGSGTTAYTLTGIAFMALAGMILLDRKRKAHK